MTCTARWTRACRRGWASTCRCPRCTARRWCAWWGLATPRWVGGAEWGLDWVGLGSAALEERSFASLAGGGEGGARRPPSPLAVQPSQLRTAAASGASRSPGTAGALARSPPHQDPGPGRYTPRPPKYRTYRCHALDNLPSCAPLLRPGQTVEAHLRRLGAVHIEGCGAYEDHHMFSLEDVQAAIERTRQLQVGAGGRRSKGGNAGEGGRAHARSCWGALEDRYQVVAPGAAGGSGWGRQAWGNMLPHESLCLSHMGAAAMLERSV